MLNTVPLKLIRGTVFNIPIILKYQLEGDSV
jgi:hypothetical protein